MRSGCTIDGVRYKGMFVRVEGGGGKGREGRNAWLTIECTEGKVSEAMFATFCSCCPRTRTAILSAAFVQQFFSFFLYFSGEFSRGGRVTSWLVSQASP